MNHYIDKLIAHLTEQNLSGSELTGGDLLEQLWYYYLEETTVDPQEILDGFREVDRLLEPLSPRSASQVFDVVCQQCVRYQRQAFLDGLRLGISLHQALSS